MADFDSLPEAVLADIVRRVRVRLIPGTNKCACVCRRWRHGRSSTSSSSLNQEEVDLQLLLDQYHMSETEWTRAAKYIAMHGQAVATLAVRGSTGLPQWLHGSAAALSGIRRLEVEDPNSLYLMAPALSQLPHLQHLAAGVTLTEALGHTVMVGQVRAFRGCFVQDWQGNRQPPWQVPDLEQLCPRLTHLRLTLHRTWPNKSATLLVDTKLGRLLPSGLEQLSLAAVRDVDDMVLQASSLVHLSGVQQLTMDNARVVAGPGVDALAAAFAALQQLQQLRLSHPVTWVLHTTALQQLAPKITSMGVFAGRPGVVNMLPHLVHLTHLALSVGADRDDVPEGMAEALAALTNLQELDLGCDMVPVMEQVAAMPTLRSLHAALFDDLPPSPSTHLAQCTQLTSLVIMQTIAGAHGGCAAVLQQLTGLRCLAVPAEVLEHQAGAWLAPLTALTRLGVRCSLMWDGWRSSRTFCMAQRLLQTVQVYLGGVQQVLVTFPNGDCGSHFKPKSWQFIPTVPGGVPVSVWVGEEEDGVAPGWQRPLRPCPHLPGVWELTEEVPGL